MYDTLDTNVNQTQQQIDDTLIGFVNKAKPTGDARTTLLGEHPELLDAPAGPSGPDRPIDPPGGACEGTLEFKPNVWIDLPTDVDVARRPALFALAFLLLATTAVSAAHGHDRLRVRRAVPW